MKRLSIFSLVFLMILASVTSAYSGTQSKKGTSITNVTELQAMQNDLAGTYYLANDIDASATSGWNDDAGFGPVGDGSTPFTGIFDGNGHTITGLYMNRPSSNEVGLFGYIDGGEVKNVGLINVDINSSGSFHAGGLAGIVEGSTVINCYVTGAVSGNAGNAGGLISLNSGIITNCFSVCVVDGASPGGLISSNSGGTYNDCFWDTETSGQATSGGGTGKTTAQMKQQATFENWNFSTIWAIVEDVSYPTLR